MDPAGLHRLSPGSSAFSASLTASYVISPHNDSGLACETIAFCNRNGPSDERRGSEPHAACVARGHATFRYMLLRVATCCYVLVLLRVAMRGVVSRPRLCGVTLHTVTC